METLATRDPAKVFFDSSVLFAATFSERGSARDLLLAGLRGEHPMAVSTLVLIETQRNLARKAPEKLPAFARLRPVLEPLVVDPPAALVRQVAEQIEVKDAPIVAAALAAGAGYLVTYDRKHLLSQATQIQAAYNLSVTTPDQVISNL